MSPLLTHFSPWTGLRRPCWHCTRFVGMSPDGSAARCNLPNGPRVRSSPADGCSAWMRETGADDEAEAPVSYASAATPPHAAPG